MTDQPPSEPKLIDQIADAVINFYSNCSSDGLERDAPTFTRVGLILAIEHGGLADLEAKLAAAEGKLEQIERVTAEENWAQGNRGILAQRIHRLATEGEEDG